MNNNEVTIRDVIFGTFENRDDEIYNFNRFRELGVKSFFSEQFEMHFEQKNILRGFYIQDAPILQNQLYLCLSGCCRITLLDVREKSESYGKHFTISLSPEGDNNFVFVPHGVAVAFLSDEEKTSLFAFTDTPTIKDLNVVINVFDPELGCKWPEGPHIMSVLDRKAANLSELKHNYW